MFKRVAKKRYESDDDESDDEKSKVAKRRPFVEDEKREGKESISISGPNKMIKLYKPLTKQTVYLFGEWHGYEDACGSGPNTFHIVNYLAKVFNSGIKIDFYLEAPLVYLLKEKVQEDYNKQKEVTESIFGEGKVDILVELRDAFKTCFHPATRFNCAFRNTRMHYTDVRPFYALESMSRDVLRIKNEDDWNIFKEKFADEIKELGEVQDCETYTSYIYNKIGLSKSIRKQLQKSGVTGEQLKGMIFQLCNVFKYGKYAEMYGKMLKDELLPRKYLEESGVYYTEIEQKLSDILQNQLSILHDIYTYLRMVKKMDGEYQKNIIFYGGLAHYETLKFMLTKSGFEIQGKEVISNRKRCLQLSEEISFPEKGKPLGAQELQRMKEKLAKEEQEKIEAREKFEKHRSKFFEEDFNLDDLSDED